MGVGENIRFFREAFNLTQQELADSIGVARSTVSQWEGGYGFPRMGNLHRLAFVFRVTPIILANSWSTRTLAAIADRALTGQFISEPPDNLPPLLEVSTLELDRPPNAPQKRPQRQTYIYTYLLKDHPSARSVTLDAHDANASVMGNVDIFYDPLADPKVGDLALVENADHHMRVRKMQLEDFSNNLAVVRQSGSAAATPDPRDVILRILGLVFWGQCAQAPLHRYGI